MFLCIYGFAIKYGLCNTRNQGFSQRRLQTFWSASWRVERKHEENSSKSIGHHQHLHSHNQEGGIQPARYTLDPFGDSAWLLLSWHLLTESKHLSWAVGQPSAVMLFHFQHVMIWFVRIWSSGRITLTYMKKVSGPNTKPHSHIGCLHQKNNSKPKREKVAYRLKCMDCEDCCVGQTRGRRFTRMHEYKLTKERQNSFCLIAFHGINEGHKLDLN